MAALRAELAAARAEVVAWAHAAVGEVEPLVALMTAKDVALAAACAEVDAVRKDCAAMEARAVLAEAAATAASAEVRAFELDVTAAEALPAITPF